MSNPSVPPSDPSALRARLVREYQERTHGHSHWTSASSAAWRDAAYELLLAEKVAGARVISSACYAHENDNATCEPDSAGDSDPTVAELLETNERLNRRAQSAEAALNERTEDWNKRSTDKQRNHYYTRYTEAEAALATLRAQLQAAGDLLRALIARWREEIKERGGAGCGCYGKNAMQRKCADELEALVPPVEATPPTKAEEKTETRVDGQ